MALDVYLTNACNLRCKYCFNLDREDAPQVPLEDICNALAVAYKKGNRYLSVTGGEPFLYKQVFEVLSCAHDLGYWITVLTHGGLVDEEKADRLSRYWRLRVRISLDGPNRAIHDQLRGEETFDSTMDVISLLVGKGINVGVGMTVSEHNLDSVENMVELCIDRGVAFLRLSPVVRIKKGKAAAIDSSLHERLLEQIISLTIKHKRFIDFPQPSDADALYSIDALTTRRCMAGRLFFGITPDMTILPCSLIADHPEIPSFELRGEASFDEIGEAMDRLFAAKRTELGGVCSTCELRDVCFGGCLAEKISFDRRLEDEQPVCTKKIIESLAHRFEPEDMEMVVKAWVHRVRTSLEASNSYSCMRQAPYWSMSFNIYNRRNATEDRFR